MIHLGGLDFHGGHLPGETGFTVSAWQGWTGGTGQKRDTAQRQGAPGAFDVRSHAADRTMSWRGRYHGSSLADVEHMGEVLSGLEGLRLPVTVQRSETRWANVHVDVVRFDEAGYAARADYQVELWMPDPFKYGETRESVSTGANVSAHHRGNTDAWPWFRVQAPFANGYRLRGPAGESWSVTAPMTGSSVDEVDFKSGLIIRNGVPLRRAVLSPERWSVPGGATVDWRIEPIGTGGGSATMFLTDTYV